MKKKKKIKSLNLEKILGPSHHSTSESTKTMFHPKADSFLNSDSTLSLPSVFSHLMIRCDSVILTSIVTP